jgi:hypothetical protein
MYHISKVNDLKNIGYKVRVRHFRRKDKNGNILPRGGETLVTITDNHGHTTEGLAKCCDADGFNKRIGIAIAIGRALRSEEIYVNK